MENINNMGANDLEALSKNNLTESGKKKLKREILSGIAALSCLFVGLIYTYVLKIPYRTVPQCLYFIGCLVQAVPIVVSGVKGIFTKNLTNAMEILVGVAVVACILDEQLILALLIPLILNSVHILEERSIIGGRDVIEGLKNMRQDAAVLYENGEERVVDAKTLKVGERIKIKPGSGVPVDGTVVEGESHIDEKSLTGEPEPVRVKVGDPVYSGTVNLDGALIVEIRKEYVDASFSKILRLLEKSESISIPESRIVDKFLTYYIPFVLAAAAATALISKDVSKAIAILVVSCPCGQMLASSAPMIAALSMATKRGILVKNSKFVESLTEIKTVVFDKTGTITKGSMSITRAVPFDGVSERELLTCAKAAALNSTHPVSKAIVDFAADLECSASFSSREISGEGTEGTNADGDMVIRLGNLEWIERTGTNVPAEFLPGAEGSVSYVTLNGRLLGYLRFSDAIRDNAKNCVDALKAVGVEKSVMLTGDRAEPAERIGAQAGIDEVYSKLLPQDKLTCLKNIDAGDGKILAVGDGINDALLLKGADVGVAMGAMGSDLAIDSADIALMNNNLMNIPYAINLAEATRKTIYQNLVLSVTTSFAMILLSAFGAITALSGSFLHNIGAVAVLLNSSRILKGKYEPPAEETPSAVKEETPSAVEEEENAGE